jgi:FlaG/FlaF family flagellin (archaellin)
MLLRLIAVALTLAALTVPAFAQSSFTTSLSPQEQAALESARTHELRGDEVQTFEAYRAFVQLDGEAVDIDLKFAAMARARLGLDPARALFRQLGELHGAAFRLALATLTELSERRKALEAFVATHPDYGPALVLLANEYYRERIEDAPLRDRLRERELLSAFLGLDAKGKLAASFADSTMLAAWIDRAERRLAVLDASLTDARAAPSVAFSRSNSTWMVNLLMPEAATEISYRVGEELYRKTASNQWADSPMGRTLPSTNFDLPLDTPKTTILVKYRDLRRNEIGPFPIGFDPEKIILENARATLEADWPGWVQYSDGETNRDWVYFNTPMQTRCAIKSLDYGFDGPPDTPFALPPCNFANPSGEPADATSAVKMGPNVRSVSARITFLDGTVGTRSYRRPKR